MKRLIAAACALALVCGPAWAASPKWIGSWAAPPVGPGKAYSNQTIRQVVRLSAGGDQIRIRLTNEYGTNPLAIGAATVAIAGADGKPTGEPIAVTFAGQPSALIPAGAPMVSDAIKLKVANLTSLSISLYLPGDTGPCTCHATAIQTAFVSQPGDFTRSAFEAKETTVARAFLSAVDVETARPAKTVLVFGDSISDGYRSTMDGNHRWPDRLAERLAAAHPNEAWGVANLGISGNRILSPGAGDAALTRLDRDLSVPGAAYLIVFEGVNDVGMGSRPNVSGIPGAEAMIAGYRQIIERAHAKGLKVIGATIAPYEGAAYYSPEGNQVREAINAWIRTGKAFDGVIDFDAVWRDPAKPTRIRAELQAGDWLHGNDAGYKAFGDAVDLKLFN
jgi:lysophospholipase L1-like esterase